jgi:hypothetical protein
MAGFATDATAEAEPVRVSPCSPSLSCWTLTQETVAATPNAKPIPVDLRNAPTVAVATVETPGATLAASEAAAASGDGSGVGAGSCASSALLTAAFIPFGTSAASPASSTRSSSGESRSGLSSQRRGSFMAPSLSARDFGVG